MTEPLAQPHGTPMAWSHREMTLARPYKAPEDILPATTERREVVRRSDRGLASAEVVLDRAGGGDAGLGKKVVLVGNQAETLLRFRGPLIRAMVARGLEVYALVPGYTAREQEHVRHLGAVPIPIPLHRTSLSLWKCLGETMRLWAILRELRPDVVLTYFLKPIVIGSLAARWAAVPSRFCLMEGAGYVFADRADTPDRRLLRWLVTNLCRATMSQADRVFVLNPDDEALLTQLKIVEPENVVRLPGIGVDLDHFAPAPEVITPVTFLLAARLISEKGVREYVAAARQVRASCPGARFLLLGRADENPSRIPEREVASWAAEGIIEWPGYVEDVRPYLERSSVYVLPSFYREGVPRSIMEAMAMQRPVITTDAPGCRETVIHGENGFLIPVRDPHALAEAMMRFIRQPELIGRMGRASRRRAESVFDVHGVNATILRAMGC